MKTVIGVKFKKTNKIYYFDPSGVDCQIGDFVIVETAQGPECAEVVMGVTDIEDSQLVSPLRNVIRKLSESDLKKAEKNKLHEKEALEVFEKKILEHKLEMKPVDVEYAFDASKITFYFTADGRVDFRELVKDLAHHFKTRIELRQIGVRDEAKMLGGIGKCGFPICCKRFLPEFSPVSIKMAKEQNISLNPGKISGLCGRLMCCLNFEQTYYEDMKIQMPKIGQAVITPEGEGTVVEYNAISTRVRVKIEKPDGTFDQKDFLLEALQFERLDPKFHAKEDEPEISDIFDEDLPVD